MTLPESFLSELKARADLIEIGSRCGVSFGAGKAPKAPCPFHRERDASFTAHADREPPYYRCYGCGWHGDTVDLVKELKGLEWIEAVRYVAEAVGMRVPERAGAAEAGSDPEAERRREALAGARRALERAQAYFAAALRSRRDEAQRARRYLEEERGIPLPPAEEDPFGWGYAPQRGTGFLSWMREQGSTDEALRAAGLIDDRGRARFRGRLTLPIRDARGRTVSFFGRLVPADAESRAPKGLNGPETELFAKRATLYGLDLAAPEIRRARRAVVVEGQIDRVQLHRHGCPESLALQGSEPTRDQVELVARLVGSGGVVVWMGDGDAAGRKLLSRALSQCLELGVSARAARLPDGEDPDSWLRAAGGDG